MFETALGALVYYSCAVSQGYSRYQKELDDRLSSRARMGRVKKVPSRSLQLLVLMELPLCRVNSVDNRTAVETSEELRLLDLGRELSWTE